VASTTLNIQRLTGSSAEDSQILSSFYGRVHQDGKYIQLHVSHTYTTYGTYCITLIHFLYNRWKQHVWSRLFRYIVYVQTFRQLHFSMSNHLLIYTEQVNYSTGCSHHTECMCHYRYVVRPWDPQNKHINIYLTDFIWYCSNL
jgi:hypothetical protein